MLRFFRIRLQRRKIANIRKISSTHRGRTYSQRQNLVTNDSALGTFWKRDGVALIGIIVILFGGTWYFGFHRQWFLVRDIRIEGRRFIPEAELQSQVRSYLLSRRWKIIPQDTYWTVRPVKLEEKLRTEFSSRFALADIHVYRDFPQGLHITLTEHVPHVAWVTVGTKGQEHRYLLDREGIVTQEIAPEHTIDSAFPIIRDENRSELGIGWHIISAAFLDAVLEANQKIPEMFKVPVTELKLPIIRCQEREYVAEEIFQEEIASSESEAFREKKRKIQKQFQEGGLTIDESLDALDRIKKEESNISAEAGESAPSAVRQWKTIYVQTPCDLVTVGRELHVRLRLDDQREVSIFFDTALSLDNQLEHAQQLLRQLKDRKENFQYIDTRIPDRVYYK